MLGRTSTVNLGVRAPSRRSFALSRAWLPRTPRGAIGASTASAAPLSPAERARPVVVAAMSIAQFGLFVALLAPVTVSLALKTQTLVPRDEAAAVNGNVLAVAALVALVGNPVFGRLSDL